MIPSFAFVILRTGNTISRILPGLLIYLTATKSWLKTGEYIMRKWEL